MEKDPHFIALERMYQAAPINEIFKPRMDVSEAKAEIEIEVTESLFHAGDALHGSVYFKILDDAAFFAANSLERNVFVLTASFTIYLLRPVKVGRLRAVGSVLSQTRSQFIAEAVAYDGAGKEVARGTGSFVRSPTRLTAARGYSG